MTPWSQIKSLGLASVFFAATVFLIDANVSAQDVLDPNNAEDAFRMNTKIFCSLEEGKPSVYWWQGTVYSRIRGEKDRHLFNVQGMNIRACKNFEDDVRGIGSRSVSREVMFFLDPETNEVIREWENPWTGETVEVVHVANDPVNSRARVGRMMRMENLPQTSTI